MPCGDIFAPRLEDIVESRLSALERGYSKMPCESGPSREQMPVNSLAEKLASVTLELDKVTAMLCYVCKTGGVLGPEVLEWCEKHKEHDEKREQQILADVRKRLMAQLTDTEKRALGLLP